MRTAHAAAVIAFASLATLAEAQPPRPRAESATYHGRQGQLDVAIPKVDRDVRIDGQLAALGVPYL